MTVRLSTLDAVVLVSYLLAVIVMSAVIASRQRSGDDCFLAARSMTGVPTAMSILANQVSTVSLIGAPAFVALRPAAV